MEDHAITVVVADSGMGKTALVNEVGHSLTKKGISVVYFSLRRLHTVEEGARQFLKLFDLRPGENPEKEVIKLAHELKEETVIIVDNIHHLMKSSDPYFRKENNILTLISEIAGASQDRKVKILATSREEVNSVEWHNFLLDPLSKEKAIKLLQMSNRPLAAEEAKHQATLSSGSPLHPIILASIRTPIGRQSVPGLPEILARWFEELEDLKHIALELTVFPAEFTLKEVNEIFYPTVNTETLVSTFNKLTDRCLLTKDGDYYAIHSSVESFLESHATKIDGRREVLQNARKKFIYFQIKKLDKMYKQFLSHNPQPAINEFNNSKTHVVQAFLKAIQGWGVNADGLKEKCIDSANKTIEFLSKVMGRTEIENLLRLFADYCKSQDDQRRLSECWTSIGVKIIYSCTCQVLCPEIQERALEYLELANEIQEASGINKGFSRAQCLGKLGRCYALMEASGGREERDQTGANNSDSTTNAEALHLVNSAVQLERECRSDLESEISLAISHHDAAGIKFTAIILYLKIKYKTISQFLRKHFVRVA